MISFRNFALRRGERLLLSDVDLTLQAGWRVGVVGRNGTGKSSLFAALRNEIEADRGDLDLSNRVRIASIAQEMPSLPDAAIDFVLSGDLVVHAALQAEANAFANEDWEAVAEAHHRLEEVELAPRQVDARSGARAVDQRSPDDGQGIEREVGDREFVGQPFAEHRYRVLDVPGVHERPRVGAAAPLAGRQQQRCLARAAAAGGAG